MAVEKTLKRISHWVEGESVRISHSTVEKKCRKIFQFIKGDRFGYMAYQPLLVIQCEILF